MFPLGNQWRLRWLALRELLEFPESLTGVSAGERSSPSLKTFLNAWRHPELDSKPAVGDYLHAMGVAAEDVELPPIMTYRTAQQVFQKASLQNASGARALTVMRSILDDPLHSDDLVRIPEARGHRPAIEYRRIGELAALFRPGPIEQLSGQADIVMSARPDFVYGADPSSHATRMTASSKKTINFTSMLVAVGLREDGYGVDASGLRWNIRLALAWTHVRIFDRVHADPNLDMAFQWRFHEHPSPMRLLEWTKKWGEFVQEFHGKTEDRLDRIAYAWIYYQLRWLDAAMDPVPQPFDPSFNTDESWDALLELEPRNGSEEEKALWKEEKLPLLARPEIGLSPRVQQRLLRPVKDSSNPEVAVRLWDQRRRLVTDAILAAAAEELTPAKDAEDLDRVERAIGVFERRHRNAYKAASPWRIFVEEPAKASREAGTGAAPGNHDRR